VTGSATVRIPTDPTGQSDRPVHLVYEDPMLAARDRAGRAVRRLAEALIGREVTATDLAEITVLADRAADSLERHGTIQRPDDYQARRYTIAPPEDGDRLISFTDRPISGPGNPAANELVIWRDGLVVRAVATFGRLSEASPGRVHGGITAATFDDVMGYVMIVEATAAYTGELTVRYRAPMLLGVPIHFAAEVTERGTKVWTIGATARAGSPDGDVVSEASGRFVVVSPERLGVSGPA
jgi:acyl-coenzyme A thioesterase PaaI-like protein